MLIKSEQLSVVSLIKNVMLKYLFWVSYILRLCAQTCTPNRHALECQTTLQAKVKYIKIVLHAKVVDWSTGVFILWKKLFSIIPSYGKSIALGWTI